MPGQNIAVNLVGKGKLTLRQSNYVTTGGEASIYKIGDTICKIFTDPAKMIADKMTEKVNLLAQFRHPYIVNPLGVIEDERHNPIGYYMGFAEGEALSRVFTTAYRQRENFGDQEAIQLVHAMREVPIFAHSKGAVLVDANELNWLMQRSSAPEPRIVDVDSWQIGSRWPARVIMPSIRDFHAKAFDEHSDWFSWAVVTFQIFTGIHPYKGRHDDYKPNELERRMKDNVSVFNPDVHLNAAVRDFSVIPGRLLDWYKGVFEVGDRSQPPSPLDRTGTQTAARQIRQTVTTSGDLIFEVILNNVNDPVVRVYPCGIALLRSGTLMELNRKQRLPVVTFAGKPISPAAEIVQTKSGYLIAERDQFAYVDFNTQVALSLGANVYGNVRSGNRMFAVTDTGLTELNLLEMGKPLLTLGQTWNTMRLSTQWFEGVGVQNSLGAYHLVLPFLTQEGKAACGFIRVPELDGISIVNAQAGTRFVSVVGLNQTGEYKKFEFTLDRDYQKYSIWIGDADNAELNLAILPSGVCATIVRDGELVIFVPQNGNVRKVADKNINTAMDLATWGDKVVFIHNGGLQWVRLK
jgi:hypothetical protein